MRKETRFYWGANDFKVDHKLCPTLSVFFFSRRVVKIIRKYRFGAPIQTRRVSHLAVSSLTPKLISCCRRRCFKKLRQFARVGVVLKISLIGRATSNENKEFSSSPKVRSWSLLHRFTVQTFTPICNVFDLWHFDSFHTYDLYTSKWYTYQNDFRRGVAIVKFDLIYKKWLSPIIDEWITHQLSILDQSTHTV